MYLQRSDNDGKSGSRPKWKARWGTFADMKNNGEDGMRGRCWLRSCDRVGDAVVEVAERKRAFIVVAGKRSDEIKT